MGELRGCRKNSHILLEMMVELQKQGLLYTVKKIKTKMHNLGTRYIKEKQKVGTTGGSPSEWDLFTEMQPLLAPYKSYHCENLVKDSVYGIYSIVEVVSPLLSISNAYPFGFVSSPLASPSTASPSMHTTSPLASPSTASASMQTTSPLASPSEPSLYAASQSSMCATSPLASPMSANSQLASTATPPPLPLPIP